MFKEFKEFAVKGNVLDLAVAVVIGGAFGQIVTSLVNDIIMPLVGAISGGINFSHLMVVLKSGTEEAAALTLNYGMFIQNIVDFLIVSFSIFMFIRLLNKFKKEEVEEVEKPEEPEASEEVLLLRDIRNLLKEQENN